MRKAREEETCQLPAGPQRDEHLKSAARTFGDERKAKEATSYVYLLVVQFVTDKDRKPVMENGIPTYNLRVMKLSTKRLEKIVTQVSNAGEDLPGSELLFSYPDTDDLRLAVGQSTITLVFPNKRLTALYPALMEKIDADVKKFSFEGLDKQGFTEWAGMTTAAAQKVTDAQFEQWDKYQKELKVNPNAQYLEYITVSPSANPSLSGAPAAPTAPTAPTIAVPGLAIPSVATPDSKSEAPATTAAPDVPGIGGNIADLFGSAGGGIQL